MSTLSLINTFNPFAHFKKEVSEIYQRISNRSVFIPLYGYKKQSLNVDVIEASLSTDKYLVQNPMNTYFIKNTCLRHGITFYFDKVSIHWVLNQILIRTLSK